MTIAEQFAEKLRKASTVEERLEIMGEMTMHEVDRFRPLKLNGKSLRYNLPSGELVMFCESASTGKREWKLLSQSHAEDLGSEDWEYLRRVLREAIRELIASFPKDDEERLLRVCREIGGWRFIEQNSY